MFNTQVDEQQRVIAYKNKIKTLKSNLQALDRKDRFYEDRKRLIEDGIEVYRQELEELYRLFPELADPELQKTLAAY